MRLLILFFFLSCYQSASAQRINYTRNDYPDTLSIEEKLTLLSDFKGDKDSLVYASILFPNLSKYKRKPVATYLSFFGKKYDLFVDTFFDEFSDSEKIILTYINNEDLWFERRISMGSEFFHFYSGMNGRHNGVFPKFYSNGSLKEICSYSNDVEIGIWFEFYPNGKLKSIKDYNFDNNDSSLSSPIWEEELANYGGFCCETIFYSVPFKRPQRADYYYYSGCIEHLEYYKDRRKTGTWKYFHENGKLKREEEYEFGVLVRIKQY